MIFEWAESNYSAYVPDLPGCVTTGRTLEDTERGIEEAMAPYIEALREDGKPIPEPTTTARPIRVAA